MTEKFGLVHELLWSREGLDGEINLKREELRRMVERRGVLQRAAEALCDHDFTLTSDNHCSVCHKKK